MTQYELLWPIINSGDFAGIEDLLAPKW